MFSNNSVIFIDYYNGKLILPMDYCDLIPNEHVVRVIKGDGQCAFHPKIMTMDILYAYTLKIYLCHDIAKALREHLPVAFRSTDIRFLHDKADFVSNVYD